MKLYTHVMPATCALQDSVAKSSAEMAKHDTPFHTFTAEFLNLCNSILSCRSVLCQPATFSNMRTVATD